jgi:hypothetical protein
MCTLFERPGPRGGIRMGHVELFEAASSIPLREASKRVVMRLER